ncbi:MAG: permease [Marinomonas sp.]
MACCNETRLSNDLVERRLLVTLLGANAMAWVKSHKMLAFLVAGLLYLYIFQFSQFQQSVLFIVESLLSLAPFILVSNVFVGWLNASGFESVTARVFKTRTIPMIFLASVFGAISPLCSCGVIPVILGLLSAGVPLAPVMAFWIASPIMDPEMFVLLTGAIGLDFAIAKMVIAFGMGVSSGLITYLFTQRGWLSEPLNLKAIGSLCQRSDVLEDASVKWRFWHDPERIAGFNTAFINAFKLICISLVFAFFLESLMVSYIPAESVATFVNGDKLSSVFKAIVIGIPIYLNGYAAIPLVDRLMEYGMLPGVAMAFMIGGSVTSIPAIFAVLAITRKAVFLWYLLSALISALLLSYAYQLFLYYSL